MSTTDTSRAILAMLSEGLSTQQILRQNAPLTPLDIQSAAAEALAMLEAGESRAQRVARVRRVHPRAFEPWSDEDDADLAENFRAGARVADLARATGRPPGAVRMRLEKLLGPQWRAQGGPAQSSSSSSS